VVASQKNTDKNVAEMLNLAITMVSLMDEADGKVKKFLAWVRLYRKDELVRRSENRSPSPASTTEISVIKAALKNCRRH
jgi:hypothetical protein